jgi:hypothetical protein
MGSHSPDLCFYWYVSWEDLGPAVVTKIKVSLNQGSDNDAHINWLEYAASTINFAAVIVASQQPKHARPYPPTSDLRTIQFMGNHHLSCTTRKLSPILCQIG